MRRFGLVVAFVLGLIGLATSPSLAQSAADVPVCAGVSLTSPANGAVLQDDYRVKFTWSGEPKGAASREWVSIRIDADKNGNRTAKADVWVTINGETAHVSGSASGTTGDDPLYTAAINNAVAGFTAGLSPTEVSDSFPVRQGEGLEAANEKLLDGDLAGAVAAYNARLAQVPNDVKALCNLSAALTALGDLQGALDAANRAADADTSNFHTNREYEAREAAGRLARTTKVLDVTAYGAPKKQ